MKFGHLMTAAAACLLAASVAQAQTATGTHAPPAGTAMQANPDKGVTSGPAAGSNEQPSTVTAKQQFKNNPAEAQSVATGAPGVSAAKGAESGKMSSRQRHSHRSSHRHHAASTTPPSN